MAFIKCKICGGDVEAIQGATWGTCDYCGSRVTFPKDSTEQRVNLFNRADAFRRQNEFDKAISAYEKILEEDQTDAEAHWGAAISRFGIEYVENPLTAERKPTLHRLQTTSILADEDYKAAIENAPDDETRMLYEQQAQEIADIQKKVLEQSEREEQYDIFISYKESDAEGNRTHDSVLAFDIYNALTREGYNVFYAKESLKGRLGDEYEPIIFSALRSSQVMILVGTKKEYFEAEWVRNEWTRYLDLMHQEKDKPQDEQIPRQLIPCYKDMDAYELPVELNMLQSMNMNSLGFLQDLLNGVKKIMDGGNQNTYVGKTDEISRLLQRAMNQAEMGDFGRADALAEKVLDTDPNNAAAQMVKLLVQLKVNTPDELVKQKQPLTHNRLYIMACRNAKGALKKRYESYNKKIISNLELAEKQKNLDQVLTKVKALEEKEKKLNKEDDAGFKGVSKAYIAQAEALEQMGGFGGADEKAKELRKHADDIEHDVQVRVEERKRRMEEELARKCAIEEQAKREREAKEQKEREEKAAREKAEQERLAKIRRRKARKRLAVFLVILAIAAAVAAYKVHFEDKLAYTAAVDTIEQSDTAMQLDYAESIMNRLGDDYEDVAQRQRQISADRQFINYAQKDAYHAYQTLDPQYRTAAKMSWYSEQYQTGLSLLSQKKFDDAIQLFSSISYYQDSSDSSNASQQILRAYMLKGDNYVALGKYTDALNAYYQAGNFEDTAKKIEQTQAALQFESGFYEEAYGAYKQLDAKYFTQAHKTWYDQQFDNAKALLDSGDYENAINAFEAIRYYSEDGRDASEQLRSAHYSYAKDLMINQQTEAALEQYQLAVPYSNSESLIRQINADILYDQGSLDAAYVMYSEMEARYQTHQADYQQLFDEADHLLLSDGRIKDSIERFEQIIYMDSAAYPVKEKLTTAYLTYARSLLTPTAAVDTEKVDEAKAYFTLAGVDGTEEIANYYFLTGKQALAHDDPEAAKQAFELAGWTDEAEQLMKEYYYQLGLKALTGSQLNEAKTALQQVAAYQDADELLNKIDLYEQAEALLKKRDVLAARNAYLAIGDFLNASQMADNCAEYLYKSVESAGMTERLAMYEQLGDYADCSSQIENAKNSYQEATLAYAQGEFEKAAELYAFLGDYQDSEDMYVKSEIALGRALVKNGSIEEGINVLSRIDPMLLEENEVAQATIAYADTLMNEGRIFKALAIYQAMSSDASADTPYDELLEKTAASVVDDASMMKQYEALTAQDAADPEVLYQAAKVALKAGLVDSAITILKELGDYKDAVEILNILAYEQGLALYQKNQYKQAIPYFELAKGYKDTDTKLKFACYSYARELYATKEYQQALELYEALGNYNNSAAYAQKCQEAIAEQQAAMEQANAPDEPAAGAEEQTVTEEVDEKATDPE